MASRCLCESAGTEMDQKNFYFRTLAQVTQGVYEPAHIADFKMQVRAG